MSIAHSSQSTCLGRSTRAALLTSISPCGSATEMLNGNTSAEGALLIRMSRACAIHWILSSPPAIAIATGQRDHMRFQRPSFEKINEIANKVTCQYESGGISPPPIHSQEQRSNQQDRRFVKISPRVIPGTDVTTRVHANNGAFSEVFISQYNPSRSLRYPEWKTANPGFAVLRPL